jgi:hypothetical protein
MDRQGFDKVIAEVLGVKKDEAKKTQE